MRQEVRREGCAPLPARRVTGPIIQLSPGCLGSTCLIITAYPNGALITFTNVAGLSTFNVGGFVNFV